MSRYRKERRDILRGLVPSGPPIMPRLGSAGAVVLSTQRAPAGSPLTVTSDAGPTAETPSVYISIPGPNGASITVTYRGTAGAAALDELVHGLITHRVRTFGDPMADDANSDPPQWTCECGYMNAGPLCTHCGKFPTSCTRSQPGE